VDVTDRIEEQLKSHEILLYMKGTPDFPQCGFSGQTVAALNSIVGGSDIVIEMYHSGELKNLLEGAGEE
jgi:monothiol glutaredoxin